MRRMLDALDVDRYVAPDPERSARTSYRYLRIAIASMIVAVLASVILEYLDAGQLLTSLSAYYFTPVHAIFIGGIMLIGICLIAIRGDTRPEEVALNLAGLFMPFIALIPTTYPRSQTYPNLISPDLPLGDFQLNNVLALGIAGVFALLLSLWLGTRFRTSALSSVLTRTAQIGLALAALSLAVLLVVQVVWGSTPTHNVAAVGAIFCLFFVTTANAVRNLRDENGATTWLHQGQVGLFGSLALVSVALTFVGIVRIIAGDGFWLAAIAAVVGLIVTIWRSDDVRKYLFPPADERQPYDRAYLATAMVMVAVAPILAFWPGTFTTRTFWVELAELLPFGFFWVLQTFEKWDAPSMPSSPSAPPPAPRITPNI